MSKYRPAPTAGRRRDADPETKEERLAAKPAKEQQDAAEWAEKFNIPTLEGSERASGWGERTRRQLITAAHRARRRVRLGSEDGRNWRRRHERSPGPDGGSTIGTRRTTQIALHR